MSIGWTEPRRVLLGTIWALEPRGFEEIQEKFKEAYPETEFQFEYLEDSDTLAISGVLDEDFQIRGARLLAEYINAHQRDDCFEAPRIRRIHIPTPLPSPELHAVDAEHDTLGPLPELPRPVSTPTKCASAPTYRLFWNPVRCGIKPFYHDAYSLLPRIGRDTDTSIECEDPGRGVLIEAPDMPHINTVERALSMIEECMDLIVHPHQTVMFVDSCVTLDNATFRILNYSELSATALWRVLGNHKRASLLSNMSALVICEFDEKKNRFRPIRKLRHPPHVNVNRQPYATQDWEEFTFPEIGPRISYADFLDVDMHLPAESEVTSRSTTPSHQYLSRKKASDIGEWVDNGTKNSSEYEDQRVPDEPVITEDDSEPPEPREEIVPILDELQLRRRYEEWKSGVLHTPLLTDGYVPPAENVFHRMKPTQNLFNPRAPKFVPSQIVKNWGHFASHEKTKSNEQSVDDKIKAIKALVASTPPPELIYPDYIELLYPVPEPIPISRDFAVQQCQAAAPAETLIDIGDTPSQVLFDSFAEDSEASILNLVSPQLSDRTGFSHEKQSAVDNHGEGPSSISRTSNDIAKRFLLEQIGLHSRPTRAGHESMSRPQVDPHVHKNPVAPRVHTDLEGLRWDFPPSMGANIWAGKRIESPDSAEQLANKDESDSRELRGAVLLLQPDSPQNHSRGPSAAEGIGPVPTAGEDIGHSWDFPPDMYSKLGAEYTLSHRDELAITNEAESLNLKKTMFHQRPSPDSQNHSEVLEETRAKQQVTIDQLESSIKFPEPEQTVQERVASLKAAILKKEEIEDPVQTLFNLLEPTLTVAATFPGAMNLEIQFGLNPILGMQKLTNNHTYNYAELQRLFFPDRHVVPRPLTVFFNRLTTSPADIDHIIGLQINNRRIFDDKINRWDIKYEFYCHADKDRAIIISVDERGGAIIRYPEVQLGSVHLNFPGQVWDASATVTGIIGYAAGVDLTLDQIARKMVKSIWIEPNNERLRFLFRPPKTRIIIDKIKMERWTRHHHDNDEIADIYLQIKETQELYSTVSVLDPDITVVQTGSREQMLHDGTQWWRASLISVSMENILASNQGIKPGTCNEAWNPEDLLGKDEYLLRDPGVLGKVVGHSGLRAMFNVGKMVVQGIDAIGFWNKGPASLLVKTKGAPGELVVSSEGDDEVNGAQSSLVVGDYWGTALDEWITSESGSDLVVN